MEIIYDIQRKIKNFYKYWGEQTAIALIIILVALSSFGIGRLSISEENKTPIQITKSEENKKEGQQASAILSYKDTQKVISGGIVASKSGSVYHFPWCSGASRMKEENKIWFNSIEEAKEAGLRAAKNCKGLK